MDNESSVLWQRGKSDDIEIVLGMEDALLPALLETPSLMMLGDSAPQGIRSGTVRLRIGRQPIAQNLRALYKRNGRAVPEEFEVFWKHEIWLFNHSMGVLGEGDDEDIEQLSYELSFPKTANIVEVLPHPRYLATENGNWKCEVDLCLNGRAVDPSADKAVFVGSENLNFGGRIRATSHPELVGRLSLDVMTPSIMAIGAGDNFCQLLFSRQEKRLKGYQSTVVMILADKYMDELACTVRLQSTISGLNGVPTRLRSKWIPLTVSLQSGEGAS
jgi:hypothetical protein